MGDWARRGFLRGATGMLVLGTGGALYGRRAAALVPLQPRRTLLLDGAAAGPVLATIEPAADGVKYEQISFRCGTGMSKSLYSWLQAGPDGATRRSGALVDASGERLEFTNARISEIGMPALDARGKDPAWISVKARPESTRRTVGAKLKTVLAPPAAKKWLPANFSIRIDGLDEALAQVERIEALTIKQKVVRDSLALQWEHPARDSVETPNLVLTLPESQSSVFWEWLESSLGQKPSLRAGSLAYLADDDATELFTVKLAALRPLRLTPEKVEPGSEPLRRVKVEMYCEEMSFFYTPAAVVG